MPRRLASLLAALALLVFAEPAWAGMQYTAPPVGSGRLSAQSSTPGVSSCGSGASIVGNDNVGKVTAGTVPGTACLVTFAGAWANAPSCVVTRETTGLLLSGTTSTTTLTIGGVLVAADVYSYVCIGR